MNLSIKSLLKDRNVLYVVLFLAVTNLLGYLLVRDFDAIIFFLIVGFLTSYFSKNMIVIMLVAMLSTNLLVGSHKAMGKTMEGMTSGRKNTKENAEEKEKNADKKEKNAEKKETFPSSAPASLDAKEAGLKPPRIDYAATLEQAYDNLDQMLGTDAISKMSTDTQGLISQQQKLMESIKNIEPMMDKASGMLKSLEGMGINVEGIMSKIDFDKVGSVGGLLGNLTGGKKE